MIDKEKFNTLFKSEQKQVVDSIFCAVDHKFIACSDWELMCEFLLRYTKELEMIKNEQISIINYLKQTIEEMKAGEES